MKKLRLLTEISGSINGSKYHATGEGLWNGEFSEGAITFDKELKDFPVAGQKSWHCKHHNSHSTPGGFVNPFDSVLSLGETISATGLVTFPGYQGQLEVSATISRKLGVQYVTQARNGYFSGPVDVVKHFDYEHNFIPQGNGIVLMESLEHVGLSDGSLMPIKYVWNYKIPTYIDILPFKVKYHIRHLNYQNKVFTISIMPKAYALSTFEVAA